MRRKPRYRWVEERQAWRRVALYGRNRYQFRSWIFPRKEVPCEHG